MSNASDDLAAQPRDQALRAAGDPTPEVGPLLDVVVRGGLVVSGGARRTVDVGVLDGRIAQLGGAMRARREIDAHDLVVIPGLVDPHVHLSAPELLDADEPTFADDFHTGSLAALAGGVTTFGQMSFPVADEGLLVPLQRDRAACRVQAAVDWFLHPAMIGAHGDVTEEIAQVAQAGHTSLKMVVLAFDWPGDEHGARIARAVRDAGRAGLLTLAHCEDQLLIDAATAELVGSGHGDAAHYPRSRPPASESVAVERMIALGEAIGAPVYVVHLSSAAALDACRRARARGVALHVETRPLYLGLTEEVHTGPDAARFVGMPPVRSRADVDALWVGLADGTIDTIGSDHAPWTLEQKLEHADDVEALRKGVAELETMLPLLWTEGVSAGRLSIERLVEITSTTAARLFALPGKGRIEVGADADLVVVDPRHSRVVDGSTMQSRAGYCVYDGRTLHGWPRWVMSRGDVVLDDGVIAASPGRGREAQHTRAARRARSEGPPP